MGSFFIDFDLDVGQRQHGRFLSQCIYAVQLFSFVLYQSKKTSHSFICGHIFGRVPSSTVERYLCTFVRGYPAWYHVSRKLKLGYSVVHMASHSELGKGT